MDAIVNMIDMIGMDTDGLTDTVGMNKPYGEASQNPKKSLFLDRDTTILLSKKSLYYKINRLLHSPRLYCAYRKLN
jgi:hypothetical protein